MDRTRTPLDSPALTLEARPVPVVSQGAALVRGLTFDERCRLWQAIFGEPHPLLKAEKPEVDPNEDYSWVKS